MLNHLFATILICLGVANTTPISNYDQEKTNQVLTTPKKSNITANYELTATVSNIVYSDTQVLGTGNTLYPNGTLRDIKGNIQNNNSYVNMIGNIYFTQYFTTLIDENGNSATGTFIDNKNMIDQMGTRTVMSFMLKLTPYNYNVDTESTIRLQTQILELTDQNEEDFFAYEIYYERTIYQTTSANWDEFIGMQTYREATNNIINEITNVDNGFFYTTNKQLIQIGYNEINTVVEDTFDIGITPKTDNYYFIIYRPCARFVYNTNEQTQPMKCWFPIQNNTIKISGTNIIPDGTYEVVDIPGIMFEVIGMPFAFVSQAFNLTLFPGTPYQINIANLFLSIAAIFVFVWLLLLFIEMKG